jgi:hypothetical protein
MPIGSIGIGNIWRKNLAINQFTTGGGDIVAENKRIVGEPV